jgi:hypothetical protein
MMMKTTLAVAALGLLTGGCIVTTPTPFTFVSAAAADTGVDTVARTLAAEGQPPAQVDRQLHIVQTEWRDTGVGNDETIVRRYMVTLDPGPAGTNVTVRIDAKICPKGGYTIGGTEIRGTCREANFITPGMQTDVDTLGAKIRQALGAAAKVGQS